MKRLLGLLCLLALVAPAWASTWYQSPKNGSIAVGSDANDCTSWQTPCLTFVKMSTVVQPADTWIMLDGSYSTQTVSGTGIMNDASGFAGSSQPVGGLSTSQFTTVIASHAGNVIIEVDSASTIAPLFIGRSTVKKKFIKLSGLRFIGGGSQLYNTDHVYLTSCGFYGVSQDGGDVFSIGTIDGNWGNTYDLVENCWFRGKNRLIALNYRSDYNIWRRNVIKSDGCSSANCQGAGNPNVGFSVYNSSHVSVQNIMIVDYVLGSGAQSYSDFATSQHNAGGVDQGATEALGDNEWLGCMSLHTQNGALTFEGDLWQASTYSWIVRNFVGWDAQSVGFNFQNQALQTTSGTLVNFTVGYSSGALDGVRIVNNGTAHNGIVQNGIATRNARYGFNSSLTPSYVDVFGSTTAAYNQTTCAVGCQTGDPLADTGPSLKYLVRIENGSTLATAAGDGGPIGATIVNQYGTTGTFYDESGFNTLSSNPLWANGWPSEDRMVRELCINLSTGYCGVSAVSTNKFRYYVMNYLGNGDPYIRTGSTLQLQGVTLRGVRVGG